MKKLLFVLSVFMPIIGFAQSMAPNDIPSPNASELGRFGDIPVSYYTGKPDISIPLYELECKGVKMPIKLQYDPTGVLMNSLPGWTGHNWTLMAGGAVTRVKQGRTDEYKLPANYINPNLCDSYFNTYSRLKELEDSDYAGLVSDTIWGKYDLQPDVFYFNMPGLNGKFFMGNDGHWKVYSDSNVEVVFDVQDNSNYIEPFINRFPNSSVNWVPSKVIKGFMLRDENGTKYYFGGSNSSIEYSIDLFSCTSLESLVSWDANTWYLTRVEDRHGNTLFRLSYKRGTFVVSLFNINQTIEYYGVSTNGFPYSGESYIDRRPYFHYNGKIISPVYLNEIECIGSDGNADKWIDLYSDDHIIYDAGYNSGMETYYPGMSKKVNGVYNNSYLVSDDLFPSGSYGEHQYYYLQTSDPDIVGYQNNGIKRSQINKNNYPLMSACLRELQMIELYSRNSPHRKCYKFKYGYDSRMHLTNVYMGDSGEGDVDEYNHLAEYKLNYSGYSQLPNDYLTQNVDAWGYYTNAQKGILTEIVYPTGGVSAFSYESNTYSKYISDDRQTVISQNGTAGGLRIKSIAEYEDETKAQLLRQRTFSYNIPNTNTSSGELFAMPKTSWTNWSPQIESSSLFVGLSFFRNTSIIPLSNSFGPHIGYSYVEERELDQSKTIYYYQNISSAKDDRFVKEYSNGQASPFDMYCERGYKRGKLLSACQYDANGVLARKISHSYNELNLESDYVLSCNLRRMNYSGNYFYYSFLAGGVYKLFYPKYDVVSDTITYPEKTEIVSYQKNDYSIPTTIGGVSGHADVRLLTSKTVKRNNNTYTTTYQYPNALPVGSLERNLFFNQFCLHPVQSAEYLNGHEVSSHTTKYMQQHGLILPQYELESKYGSTPDTLITYLNYSNKGTLLQYRERGMPVTTLQWEGNDNYLKSKTVGTHVTSYTYDDAWNLSSITQPNGDKQYFNYDGLGRLIEILDRNQKVLKRFQYHYKTEQQ